MEHKLADSSMDEKLVWDTESKISDLPEALGQQSLIQKNLLYQLSIRNILDSYLPNLEIEHQEAFRKIISEINVAPKIALQSYKDGLPDPIDRKKIDSILSSKNNFKGSFLGRILMNTSVEWFMPEFINFLNAGSVKIKSDHEIRFPFLMCRQVQTSPLLINDDKYLIAIIDCESEKLKSKLLETYIKNVTLTLESAVKHQNNVQGASLVIKGRLSKDLLTWFRGSSPLEPSPIPHVEIIYGISSDADNLVPYQDYLFTLKQGTGYRLKKNNSELIAPSSKEIHQKWQVLRPYVIIDQLINQAIYESNDFISFIDAFWRNFNSLISPQFDIPNFTKIPEMQDCEFKLLVSEKIESYREKVEKESQSKILTIKNKAQKLLKKFNENSVSEVCNRVKKIANESSKNINLFYLDWSHIIYDTLNNKDYNSEFDNIQSITPETLNKNNTNTKFYRNRCILKLDELSKEYDGKLRFHFSEKPDRIGSNNDYSNRLFNWTLLTIITIYMQLDEKRTIVAEINSSISNCIDTMLQSIHKSNYSLFYQFVSYFDMAMAIKTTKESLGNKNDKYEEMVHEILDFLINSHLMPQFRLDIFELFVTCLRSRLEEIKNNEKKYNKQDEEAPGIGDFFGETNSAIEFPIQGDSEIESSDLQKPLLSEIQVAQLLEQTPLFDGISLMDYKSLLMDHGESFGAYEVTPLDEKYKKLEKINNPISFYNNNPVWKYFYFFNVYSKNENIVKYIYVLTEYDEIKVAYEPIGGNVSIRPCHSQLAKGLGVKAAGELIFQYSDDDWSLVTINNGSGHYRPPAHMCLPAAKEKIFSHLNSAILKGSVSLLNSLKPGMTLASGWDEETVIYSRQSTEELSRQEQKENQMPKSTSYLRESNNYFQTLCFFPRTKNKLRDSFKEALINRNQNIMEYICNLTISRDCKQLHIFFEFSYIDKEKEKNVYRQLGYWLKDNLQKNIIKDFNATKNGLFIVLSSSQEAKDLKNLLRETVKLFLSNNKNYVVFEFESKNDEEIRSVHVAGNFNQWLNPSNSNTIQNDDPKWRMRRHKDGIWSLVVKLEADNKYEFKYVLNHHLWENSATHEIITTPEGHHNSILYVPKNSSSAGQESLTIQEKIKAFLNGISERYIESMRTSKMWGGDIEAEYIGNILDIGIVIHNNAIGNVYYKIGDESSANTINLLLTNEGEGLGHYTLLIPGDDEFKRLEIKGDGDCLFNACIAGKRYAITQKNDLRESSSVEISELRKNSCDALEKEIKQIKIKTPDKEFEKNPIIARFKTLIECDDKHLNENHMLLPACSLRDEALVLRKLFQEAGKQEEEAELRLATQASIAEVGLSEVASRKVIEETNTNWLGTTGVNNSLGGP